MNAPTLLPTSARNAAIGGVTYHIDGELVPVLTLELEGTPVYFEHHILLWKDAFVEIGIKSLSGAFKRLLAGMPIFMTEVRGPGRIAFSRDGVGQVFPLHLQAGQALDVREHQFLAATDTLDYTFAWNKGAANMLFGGTGLFIDTFTCQGERRRAVAARLRQRLRSHAAARRADRHRAGRLGLQGSHRPHGDDVPGAEDRHLRQRRATVLEPVHGAGTRRAAIHVDALDRGRRFHRGQRANGGGLGCRRHHSDDLGELSRQRGSAVTTRSICRA